MSPQFFATGDDLRALFRVVEAEQQFVYTKTGHLRGENVEAYDVGADLPNLGLASGDQPVLCDTYLISPRGARIEVRRINARAGLILTVDQLLNPDTITITLGGQFSPGVLVAGNLGAAHDTPTSRALLASWRRAIRKQWTKRSSAFLGAGALALLQAGGRLTWTVSGPREYDLQ